MIHYKDIHAYRYEVIACIQDSTLLYHLIGQDLGEDCFSSPVFTSLNENMSRSTYLRQLLCTRKVTGT